VTARPRDVATGGAPDSGPRRVLRVVDALALTMAYISGGIFFLAAIYITVDVVGRKFLGVSSAVTDEFGGYALAFGAMWGLAYTLRSGSHVRIDILLPYLPGLMRTALNYVAVVVMAVFAGVLAYWTWWLALESFVTDGRAMSFLRTPLFVPQSLLAAGLTMLSLHAVVIFVAGVVESIRFRRLVPIEGFEVTSPQH
jgi:TRAP-type C4-dicarboxylate transport system permease small subunit